MSWRSDLTLQSLQTPELSVHSAANGGVCRIDADGHNVAVNFTTRRATCSAMEAGANDHGATTRFSAGGSGMSGGVDRGAQHLARCARNRNAYATRFAGVSVQVSDRASVWNVRHDHQLFAFCARADRGEHLDSTVRLPAGRRISDDALGSGLLCRDGPAGVSDSSAVVGWAGGGDAFDIVDSLLGMEDLAGRLRARWVVETTIH